MHDDHPPRKKRTRTLTTPHQSAVLHALLAKSRFPTTAAREEVGRQIGLSARKVQIWFQNQRQKARRPQSESGPLTRPPQFGPFPVLGGPSERRHSSAEERPSSASDTPSTPPTHASPHFSTVLPPILSPSFRFPPHDPGPAGIPPPFALQPQPQWDPHALAPLPRPEFSWSARPSFSAVAHDTRPSGHRDPHHHMITPSRSSPHARDASHAPSGMP